MSALLGMALVFVVCALVLFICWKAWGRAGLLVFAAFATLMTDYLAGTQTVLIAGTDITFTAQICAYTLLLLGLLTMAEKCDTRSAFVYTAVMILVSAALAATNFLLDAIGQASVFAVLQKSWINLLVTIVGKGVIACVAIGVFVGFARRIRVSVAVFLALIIALVVDALIQILLFTGTGLSGELVFETVATNWLRNVVVSAVCMLVYLVLGRTWNKG